MDDFGDDEDEVVGTFSGGKRAGDRRKNRDEGCNDEGLLVPSGHPFPFRSKCAGLAQGLGAESRGISSVFVEK